MEDMDKIKNYIAIEINYNKNKNKLNLVKINL